MAIREFLSKGATDGCMCLPMLLPLYELGSKKLDAIQLPWQTDAKPTELALGEVAHGPNSTPEAAADDDEDAVSTESLPALVKASSGEASPTAANIGFKEAKGSSVVVPPAHRIDCDNAEPAGLALDDDDSEKCEAPELTSPTRLTPSVAIGVDGDPGVESPEVTSPHVEDSLDDKWFKPDDIKAAYDAYAGCEKAAPLEISPIEAVESGEDGVQTETTPAVVPVTPQTVSDHDKKLMQEVFSAGNTGSSPMDGFRENTPADFAFTESTNPLPKCNEEAILKDTLRTAMSAADQQDKEAKKPHREKKDKKEKTKHANPTDDAAAGGALLQDAEVRPADGFFSIFTCRPQKACSVMREKKPKKEKKAKKEKRGKSMERPGQAS